MNDPEVGQMWDENAGVWTQLARAGYDIYRDLVNTPAFLAMLPDIKVLHGLDRHARDAEQKTLGIDYQIADTRIVAYFLIIRCRKPATP